jgi:hypothetical protein
MILLSLRCAKNSQQDFVPNGSIQLIDEATSNTEVTSNTGVRSAVPSNTGVRSAVPTRPELFLSLSNYSVIRIVELVCEWQT